MTSKTFTQGTVIDSAWLNDVNGATYNGTGVFTPAGVGAVPTDVQSKLREHVSVFDFMTAAQIADVQSNTAALDVTAAIQAAIDSVAVGTIYCPAGTYKVTATLVMGLYMKLEGFSREGTIFKFNSADAYCITGDGFSQLENIYLWNITSPLGTKTGVASYTPTTSNGWRNGLMRNVRIRDFYVGIGSTQGLSQGLMFDNIYEQVRIDGAENGVQMGAGSNNNTFIGCEFWTCIRALNLNNVTSQKFINCAFEGSTTYDFYVDTSYDVSFDTCYFEPCRGGVYTNSTGVLLNCHSTDFATANTNLVLHTANSSVGIYGFTDYNVGGGSVATQSYYKTGDATGTVTCVNARVRTGTEKGSLNAIAVDTATTSQIRFPVVAVPSSNVNTLDDYKEGTFMPTIIGLTTAGVGTYVRQDGFYTKVGRVVYFQVDLEWSAHTGTGNMRLDLGALPVSAGGAFRSVCAISATALSFTGQIAAFVVQGTQLCYLRQFATGGAEADIPIDSSASIRVTGFYFV